MKHDPLRRRILGLRAVLKLHGPSCPLCSREMSLGYLDGNWAHLIWWPKGKKFPRIIWDPQSKCLDFHHPLPSYLCESCRLAITQYKKSRGIANVDTKPIENRTRLSDECPYCGGVKAKGFLAAMAAPAAIPHILWKERIGEPFKRVRKVSLTAFLGLRCRLRADKCRNCGLLFSRYDPQKVRRDSIPGVIIWVIMGILSLIAFLIFIMM